MTYTPEYVSELAFSIQWRGGGDCLKDDAVLSSLILDELIRNYTITGVGTFDYIFSHIKKDSVTYNHIGAILQKLDISDERSVNKIRGILLSAQKHIVGCPCWNEGLYYTFIGLGYEVNKMFGIYRLLRELGLELPSQSGDVGNSRSHYYYVVAEQEDPNLVMNMLLYDEQTDIYKDIIAEYFGLIPDLLPLPDYYHSNLYRKECQSDIMRLPVTGAVGTGPHKIEFR
jgi:hypothetical protein